jgi:hypothetical protein
MWNDKALIAKRIYVTLLWMSGVIAVFGVYLVINSLYIFAHDRSVLRAELKIQIEKVSEFEKTRINSVQKKPEDMTDAELDEFLSEKKTVSKPKFDPTQPYEVVVDGRSYPFDIYKLIEKRNCLDALLEKEPESYDGYCTSHTKEELYPKVRGGLYNVGRFDYFQLIFPALLFSPLIILVLGRMWLLWVFVDNKKNS